MDSWRGFSSEDIKHIQHALEKENINNYEDENILLESNLSQKNLPSPTKIALERRSYAKRTNLHTCRKNERAENNLVTYPVPAEARLSQFSHRDNGSTSSLDTSSTSSSSPSSNSQTPCSETSPTNKSAGSQSAVTILVGEDKSYKMIHLLPAEDIPLECSERNGDTPSRPPLQKAYLLENNKKSQDASLELFQERQRLMEEQNKRKKELLTKAIADKKRQTQSEAKKIVQIQEELNRLDALLSTDVSILRNQIELASYDFNEAQKRYDKAECEFIEAKMHLFSKLERKELLTEHLCKIIETNEQRKAKKLSELMAKLEISDEKFNPPATGDEAPLFPQATSLNEITYTACSTLRPPFQNMVSRSNESHTTSDDQNLKRSPMVCELKSNGINKSMTDRNSSQALESINLITAQNLDHRSESVPCDLNNVDDS